jgi:hypothetical protein
MPSTRKPSGEKTSNMIHRPHSRNLIPIADNLVYKDLWNGNPETVVNFSESGLAV